MLRTGLRGIAAGGVGLGLWAYTRPTPVIPDPSTLGKVESAANIEWSSVAEVVVVGTGAAGCAAALSAELAGCKNVVLLEKDERVLGGTTAKSGGIFWIPNNPKVSGSKRTYLNGSIRVLTHVICCVCAWNPTTRCRKMASKMRNKIFSSLRASEATQNSSMKRSASSVSTI